MVRQKIPTADLI
jgi:hypothetical protein